MPNENSRYALPGARGHRLDHGQRDAASAWTEQAAELYRVNDMAHASPPLLPRWHVRESVHRAVRVKQRECAGKARQSTPRASRASPAYG